jgi:flagellar basal body rod protein FlgB
LDVSARVKVDVLVAIEHHENGHEHATCDESSVVAVDVTVLVKVIVDDQVESSDPSQSSHRHLFSRTGASPHRGDRQPAAPAGRVIGPRLARLASVVVDLWSIDTLQAALTYHRERHTVLVRTIANLDTPRYRPIDLERRAAGDPLEFAVPHEGHIAAPATPDAVTSLDDVDALQSSDGNAVSLERELSKIDASRAPRDRGRARIAPARGAAPRR